MVLFMSWTRCVNHSPPGHQTAYDIFKWLNASHADARPPPSAIIGGVVLEAPPTNTPEPRSTSNDLPMAAKVGIIAGVILASSTAIITAAILYHRRRCRDRDAHLTRHPPRRALTARRADTPRLSSRLSGLIDGFAELAAWGSPRRHEMDGAENIHMRPRNINSESDLLISMHGPR